MRVLGACVSARPTSGLIMVYFNIVLLLYSVASSDCDGGDRWSESSRVRIVVSIMGMGVPAASGVRFVAGGAGPS